MAECKLIVASRPDENEARAVAIPYTKRFEVVELLVASNGWIAISLGNLNHAPGYDMGAYIKRYDLPNDSFCMRLDKVDRYLDLVVTTKSAPESGLPEVLQPEKGLLGFSASCPRGYEVRGFPDSLCYRIDLPANAELTSTANSWQCLQGYIKRGNSCELVVVPENAHLRDNTWFLINEKGWACNSGYKDTGSECEKVHVPANASLNAYGNDFDCNLGYSRVGMTCREMSYGELLHALGVVTEQVRNMTALAYNRKSCSQVVKLCEDTCKRDFYGYSPSRSECEEVCEKIEDNC